MIPANPFRTAAVRPGAIEFRFPECSCVDKAGVIERIVSKLDEARVGQIVGDHGTGKSTLIQTLMPTLKDTFASVASLQLTNDIPSPCGTSPCGTSPCSTLQRTLKRYRHAHASSVPISSAVSELPTGGLLVLDGAEQITSLQRRRLVQKMHRSGTALLMTTHRPFRSTAVLYRTEISFHQLRSLTLDRVADCSPEVQALVQSDVDRFDERKGINVRDYWFELYDRVQCLLSSAEAPRLSEVTVGH